MAMRTSPPAFDEAGLRAEVEQRRAAYQAQLERDRRLLIGLAGLAFVVGAIALAALSGVFHG